MSKPSQERIKIESLLAVVRGELETNFEKKNLILTEEYRLISQRDLLEGLLNLQQQPSGSGKAKPAAKAKKCKCKKSPAKPVADADPRAIKTWKKPLVGIKTVFDTCPSEEDQAEIDRLAEERKLILAETDRQEEDAIRICEGENTAEREQPLDIWAAEAIAHAESTLKKEKEQNDE